MALRFIFLTIASLVGLSMASSNQVLAEVSNENAGSSCGITTSPSTINPNTSFSVDVTVPNTQRIYKITVNDNRSNTIYSQQKNNFSSLRLTFGPINKSGVLEPSFSPYEIRISDVTAGSTAVCGAKNFYVTPTAGTERGTCQVSPENGTITDNQCNTAAGYSCQTKLNQSEIPYWSGTCMPKTISGACSINTDCGTSQCCNSGSCGVCATSGGGSGGSGNGIGTPSKCVQTDLGCIPTDPAGLANAIFRLVLGIAGALAILLIIIGGFKVATSAGNPDNLEEGRAMITQAIIGLVFILLATSILAIIGIDILGLTNFFQRTSGGGVIVK